MDTNSFIIHVKTEDIYKDIMLIDDSRLQIMMQIDRCLWRKKVIGLIKNKMGGQIIKLFFGLLPKKYSYLNVNDDDYKQAKVTKRYVVKRKLKFQDYKNCVKAS